MERLGTGSVGIGHHAGFEVRVRPAAPGSVVEVLPFQRKRGVIHGKRGALRELPPGGREAPCPAFGVCGGCVLQELPLADQRREKQTLVEGLVGSPSAPCTGADAEWGYRNKVELSFGDRRYTALRSDDDRGRFLGFHAPGRFDKVVDLESCAIAGPHTNAILAAARAALQRSALEPWNPKLQTGFWRHLLVRETTLGQTLVGIYTSPAEGAEAEVEAMAEALPSDTVAWVVNDRPADVAMGEVRRIFRGDGTIEERLGGRTWRLGLRSFFQTNTAGAEVLLEVLREVVGQGRRLLDLYCGTGTLGIGLSDRFEEVLGVELVEEAVEEARRNAPAHCTFEHGKVEDLLPRLRPDDLALVDPPRAGLHPKAAAWLADAPLSTLVYVACNPEALARDRQVLEAGGWRMVGLWTVDLFPQTGHVEAVARFEKTPAPG